MPKQTPRSSRSTKPPAKQRWAFARQSDAKKKFSFCTPLIIDVNGQKQLITPGSGVVNALNPKDGTKSGAAIMIRAIPSSRARFMPMACSSSPAATTNRCSTPSRPDGKGDVTATHIAWTIDKAAPHNPSMAVIGDELYFVADNGILTCADAKTGQIHYSERCTGPISASLLVADGKLYLQDEKGLGVVVKPGKTFQILAQNDLGERSLASYAVIGSDLLIRTEGNLYRIKK
jgi:outer membrane protein assembly factor BamB